MAKDLLAKENKNPQFEEFFPYNPDSCRLVIACSRADYSASRIARAVEDADARLINLNVTAHDPGEGRLAVALRIDHRNPERVIRSLDRYGFPIIASESEEVADDTLRRRYEELMRMLNI